MRAAAPLHIAAAGPSEAMRAGGRCKFEVGGGLPETGVRVIKK